MVRELWALDHRPSALFAVNDLLAAGAIQEILAMGGRIPDDLAVVGYDDTPFSSMIHPPLTTVHQPIEEMGRIAFTLLLEMIEKRGTIESVLLKPYLVERATV